jgi:phage gpG-like protein
MIKINFSDKDIQKFSNKWKNKLPSVELMNNIGLVAQNYFRDSFNKQGLDGEPRWKPVDKGKALIKSGNLRRSISILSLDNVSVVVGTRLIYAEIHNEGGNINKTEAMKKYFWAMFYKTKNPKYKYMALSKKKSITIPERKFIGSTNTLNLKIKREVSKYIKKYNLK